LHLDKGYDANMVRETVSGYGFEALIARKRQRGKVAVSVPAKAGSHTLGLRWPVERTNSWLSNFGQLRRNTDRYIEHRHAQMCLAATFLLLAKLVDYRNRWSP
jgi:transposase